LIIRKQKGRFQAPLQVFDLHLVLGDAFQNPGTSACSLWINCPASFSAIALSIDSCARITSKKPLHPYETQVVVQIILAEPLDPETIRGVLQIQKAIEILLDHNIAEIHRDGAHEVQFLLVPELFGDIADSDFKGLLTANLVTCTATAAVDGVKIRGNGVAGFAERTYNDMPVDGSSKFSHKPCR
jgi:hypothetical protein